MTRHNLAFLAFLALALSDLDLTSQHCYGSGGSGNFTATYRGNRQSVLSDLAALAANITAAEGGFLNATAGREPDRIYAIALCRPGSDTESCRSCVNETADRFIKSCPESPDQREAYSWGEPDALCLVRYSSRSILGKKDILPLLSARRTSQITLNLTLLNQTWESLMGRVIARASNGLPSKYAAEKAKLTNFMDIYALALCTPDLPSADCLYCLQESARFMECCIGGQGATVWRPSCFLRWEPYPYYDAFNDYEPSSPPLPADSPLTIQTNSTEWTKVHDGGHTARTFVLVIVPVSLIVALTLLIYCFIRRKKLNQVNEDEDYGRDSFRFDLRAVRTATGNFSIENKLGQGGFGAVHKGKLPGGQDVAVKRLGQSSTQGEREFTNEVLLLARLKHKNLVTLLGFCWERSERLLIYEFIPNSSLDRHMFDPIKRLLLPWHIRYKIICGVARGLLYLHEDSRLRIIHRDIKAANILLDWEMNPKISDFGMAKLCQLDETERNTRTLAGTFGYIAPECVHYRKISRKSDVYSFGVLLLEIVSGEQNCDFCKGEEDTESLTAYAWRCWREKKALNFVDPIIKKGPRREIMRCLHIGLLCVQESLSKRPTMASVLLMLSSTTVSLPVPTKPGFLVGSDRDGNSRASNDRCQRRSIKVSVNQASITDLEPR